MGAGGGERVDRLVAVPHEKDCLAGMFAIPAVRPRNREDAGHRNVRPEVCQRTRANPSRGLRAAWWPQCEGAEHGGKRAPDERDGRIDEQRKRATAIHPWPEGLRTRGQSTGGATRVPSAV